MITFLGKYEIWFYENCSAQIVSQHDLCTDCFIRCGADDKKIQRSVFMPLSGLILSILFSMTVFWCKFLDPFANEINRSLKWNKEQKINQTENKAVIMLILYLP